MSKWLGRTLTFRKVTREPIVGEPNEVRNLPAIGVVAELGLRGVLAAMARHASFPFVPSVDGQMGR